ncbi:MAG: response regulator [Ruminiclostridium sp.]|nr:response regulator [Ruminiclostridium sp.]
MKKILIVDDEPMMLMIAKRVLSASYAITATESAEEAVGLYGSEQPDLVLSDLLMPKMSGVEMYEKLKERYGGDIPIMYMTADESDLSVLGGAPYIKKPFKPADLLAKVNDVLG